LTAGKPPARFQGGCTGIEDWPVAANAEPFHRDFCCHQVEWGGHGNTMPRPFVIGTVGVVRNASHFE
jgi:hypothetical protein